MRYSVLLMLILLLILSTNSLAQNQIQNDIRLSVVKISATQKLPNPLRPWLKQPQKIAGTGVIIKGQRILTVAHMVTYAKQIYVQPYQVSNQIPATVVALAPGIDLALLTVNDKDFFKKRPALKMAAELPSVMDKVSIYGYPIGGAGLAITTGTVSRIGFGPYLSNEYGLWIQLNNALNPGNSGGPVIANNQMVGLAFASSTAKGSNIGYVIPIEEVSTFLQDFHDNHYHGKPKMWDDIQGLENTALRSMLKLNKKTTGVLVNRPFSSSPTYPLKHKDIITAIGNYNIDNTGMVLIKKNLQLSFRYLIPKLAQQNQIRFTIQREGKMRTIDLPLIHSKKELLVPYLSGKYPSYFVWGPIAFSSATQEMVQFFHTYLSAQWALQNSPLISRTSDFTNFEGEQLVMVTSMFSHKTSKGYNNPVGWVVSHINDIRIKNLRHMVKTLRDTKKKYIEFKFADKHVDILVFDRHEVLAATEDILSENGIRWQCSPDLRNVWQKK